MLAVLVTVRVKPGSMDKVIEAALDDAQGAVRDEPGCLRFDVLRDQSDPNLIHLYEVYADPAAREAHMGTPHFQRWAAATKDLWDGDPQRIFSDTVFPSDDGWRRQKTHLLD